MRLRNFLIVFAVTVRLTGLTLGLEPTRPAEEQRANPLQAVEREMKSALDAFQKQYAEASTDEQRADLRQATSKLESGFAKRLFELGARDPAAPYALDALLRVFSVFADSPEAEAAAKLIGTHNDKEEVGAFLQRVAPSGRSPFQSTTILLRTISEHTNDKATRALTTFRLAQVTHYQAELSLQVQASDAMREAIALRFGERTIERLAKSSAANLTTEAEHLLARVTSEFSEIQGYRAIAEKQLDEMRRLGIGRVAPEIDGEDLEGKPMKLSDFRGKAVAIVFWGSWCGPCVRMIPHERELVEKYRDQPFVLLGVNADRRASAVALAKRERMTWRSWWDGENNIGPIATEWNVLAWPAVYILDADGVIRFKHVRDDSLDAAIEHVIAASSAEGTAR